LRFLRGRGQYIDDLAHGAQAPARSPEYWPRGTFWKSKWSAARDDCPTIRTGRSVSSKIPVCRRAIDFAS
jgi:hypothetical protein